MGQWIAEAVASFGLVLTILAGLRFRPDAFSWLVGYIAAEVAGTLIDMAFAGWLLAEVEPVARPVRRTLKAAE